MIDPPRLLEADADPFERELLRAAEIDRGSLKARARCLAAASPVLVVSVAKAGSAALLTTALKAAGVGVALGLVATGAVIWAAPPPVSSANAVASAQVARPALPPRSVPAPVISALPVRPEVAPERALPQAAAGALTARARRDTPSIAPPANESPETTARASGPAPQLATGASAHSAFAVEGPVVAPQGPERPASAEQPSLQREVRLLDHAREALAARDAAAALQAVQTYEREFPRGALIPEFVYLRVQALIAAGRRGEAATLAQRFLQAHPSGAQSQKLSQLMARERLSELAR